MVQIISFCVAVMYVFIISAVIMPSNFMAASIGVMQTVSSVMTNIGHMSPGNQAHFVVEVFYLDFKDHVAFDKLKSMWNIPIILKIFECNTNNIHFFGNDVCPEDGAS